MDAIAHDREQPPPPPRVFADGLRLIAPHCRWTAGTWEFGPRWNDIQNTSRDVARLSDFLLRRYRQLARTATAAPEEHRP